MQHLAINGGAKACNRQWPSWPIWDDRERDALLGVLESGKWWYGERVQAFEQAFADFQNARYGITTTNGTVALEAALVALGIGAGDEVIIPPYTFIATASAVLRINAIPVFADIEPDTLCLDPADVERKITDKTRAIVPVHLGGHVADMDRLGEIARVHGLRILEDGCHSWGSQWKGKGTGALGDCGVFSFQQSKNITSAEGGIILTDNEELADLCRSYTHCGRRKGGQWYEHFTLGTNLRLTEFQAALLLAQLGRLEEQTMRREANGRILTEGLRQIPAIRVMREDARISRRGYHFYVFRLDRNHLPIDRDQFAAALQAEGVPVSKGYTPLYKNPLFQKGKEGASACPMSCPYYGRELDYSKTCCPVCEEACNDTLWIMHPILLAEVEAMHNIAGAIRKVCENAAELRETSMQ